MFAFGVRSISVIFYCIILNIGYQTTAFRIPGLQDLLQFADEILPQNTVTQHPPEEEPLTIALCNLKTNELIAYYGYIPEVHKVTTEDGYILTVFRCNSNKTTTQANKKAVIVQHGLLASSDDFCINDPSQGLAYVLADAGYDVWLPNTRGNTYSREHIKKDPNNPYSGFWKFSWYEHGVHDYPAVIDYVRDQTNNSKVYVIGHSQGTTGLMTLLSEKPEYNEYVAAASLLAPIAFINSSDSLTHGIGDAVLIFKMFENTELLPKNSFGLAAGGFCLFDVMSFCDHFQDLLFGPSDHQRNETILPTMVCHSPNGASVNQLLHYSQELKYGYFGKYMHDSEIPSDFELWRITVPISIHYSPIDRFTNQADIDRLIPLLNNSLVYAQTVHEFNHVDFVNGIHAASLVYSEILRVFAEH